jgi:hypothetical protein
MSFNDILLQLDTFPEPTRMQGLDRAIELAKLAKGRITAVATAVDLPLPSNRLADFLIGLSKLEKEVEKESFCAGRRLIDHFTTVAKQADVFAAAEVSRCSLYLIPEMIAKRARTHDICLVPLAGGLDGQTEIAMAAMFGGHALADTDSVLRQEVDGGFEAGLVTDFDQRRAADRTARDDRRVDRRRPWREQQSERQGDQVECDAADQPARPSYSILSRSRHRYSRVFSTATRCAPAQARGDRRAWLRRPRTADGGRRCGPRAVN